MSNLNAKQLSVMDSAAIMRCSPVHIEDVIKDLIETARAALAASGGNAAPELTLPEIPEKGDKGYSSSSSVNRGEHQQHYSAHQMREYGEACHAVGRGAAVREYIDNGTFKDASAPNAALVAALEALEEVGALEDGLLGDDPKVIKAQKMARKALSAAGQEVGHG